MVKSLLAAVLLSLALSPAHADDTPSDRAKRADIAAQALLDLQFFHGGRGMVLPPGFPPASVTDPVIKKFLESIAGPLNDEMGLIIQNGQVVGIHQLEYQNRHVSVAGCALCHVGRAAGRLIPGLGNKNIDVAFVGRAGNAFLPYWEKIRALEGIFHPADETDKILKENARNFLGHLADRRLGNTSQMLVPTGIIRNWFYEQAGEQIDDTTPGQVKVPSLWGYGEKRKVGSFADGFGNGNKPGWAIAVELVAGQKPDEVRKYIPAIEHAEDALADLLPPPYPFRINATRAQWGEQVFIRDCAKCHGTYTRDAAGYPIFEAPLFIPYDRVLTDDGRLASNWTPHFRDLVKRGPLNDIMEATDLGRGYMAPRLLGVWARFPYLHNGSVPTLHDLLTPEELRPKKFSLHRAGDLDRFDMDHVGLKAISLPEIALQNSRAIYDTSMSEHSNRGHSFDSIRNMSEDDRLAVIEYLKTL